MRVIYKGKEYQASSEPEFVEPGSSTAGTFRAKFEGKTMIWLQPLNPKTGKPWQASRFIDFSKVQILKEAK